MKLSLKCKLYGDQPHTPCSGTTDDGYELPCECWCHTRRTEPGPCYGPGCDHVSYRSA